jgi:predicted MFS family arabinose efflux permease
VAAFLVSADARVIDPLLKVIAGDFHTQLEQAALVISAYTLPYGLFQLFYGPLGDRVGKLRVMSGALAFFSIGTAACGFVGNLMLFALLRFLTGVVAAALIPLSLGYIGDKFPYEQRQVALGRFMSALMLGQILSSSLGGVFGQFLGWRGIFFVFGGASLLATLALAREAKLFPEVAKPERRFSLKPYAELLAKPGARVVIGAVCVEGFLVFGGQPYLGASLKDRFGLRYDQIGLLLGGIGLGGLAYSFGVKRLVAKIGELGILLLGGSLLAIGYVGVAFLPAWPLFLPFVLILGMGYFTMHGTLQTRATELAPQMRGTAVSLFAFSFFLGQSVGAAAVGRLIAATSYSTAFTAVGLSLLVLALVVRQLFKRMAR